MTTTQLTNPNAGVSDHGALTGLSDDDHLQYLLLAGRAGGQVAIGGTAAGEELGLRGSSNANLGLIRASSPIVFDDISAANALSPYSVADTATQVFTAGFVGGVFNASPNIDFSNALFIWEGMRGAPLIESSVAPGFAAFTLFNALPVLRAGPGAGQNPLQALVLNAGATLENDFTGTKTAVNNLGVSWAPQTRAGVSGAVMTVTNQTGISCRPTFSTVSGATANLGTIRGLHAQNPAVALFQPQAGVETMTAYYAVDVTAIPFGGTVPKAAVRSALVAATNTFFLQNIGTAHSTFNSSHLFDLGITQHLGDGVLFSSSYGAAGGDVTTYWDGTGFVFDPLSGTTARWDFGTDVLTLVAENFGAGAAEFRFGWDKFAFGQTGSVGNQVGIFVAPARATGVAGGWSDFLLTQAGNLTIDHAMGQVAAWTINPISLTAGAGSISDRVSTLVVGGMTTSGLGGAETEALFVRGRHTMLGVMAPLALDPAALTADVNDYAPATGSSMRQWWRLTTDDLGARNITGIAVQQVDDLQWVTNVGTVDNIVLQHQNAGSAAANRIISPTGADYTLGPDESAALKYDPTTARWRIVWGTGA